VASELIFTGDLIGAEKAAGMGLVNRVVAPQQLLETARELAERIASRAPVAVAKAKAAILADNNCRSTRVWRSSWNERAR
jgi:enoyl-CoA hydratase